MSAFYTEFLDMINYNSTEYNKTHAQNLFQSEKYEWTKNETKWTTNTSIYIYIYLC